MLPASPRTGGRSTSRRPAQYPSQTRSVSRPRERDANGQGAGRSMDYESATRSRENERPQRSNTTRQVRQQRSMGNLPSSTRAASSSSRDAAPPMPRPYNAPPKSAGAVPSSYSRSNPRSGSTSSNASSNSSASSSGSSFLERMRVRYPDSSQTSLELDEQESPKDGTSTSKWYGSREWRATKQSNSSSSPESSQDRRVRDRNRNS